MEELFSFEKSIIDEQGKMINIKIYEIQSTEIFMTYRCVIDGDTEMILTIDDDGHWCDKNAGQTKLAETIGNIIEDHFE
jgi:hypothetical protein